MTMEKLYDLLVAIVFAILPQIGGLVHNTHNIVTYPSVKTDETLPEYHLYGLQSRSEIYFMT